MGVTTAKRVTAIPDVAAIGDSGLPNTKGFDSSIWFGVFAPKGTDPRVVQKMNQAIRQVLEQAETRAKLEAAGNSVRIETPEQFKATVRANRAKWAEVVKAARITID